MATLDDMNMVLGNGGIVGPSPRRIPGAIVGPFDGVPGGGKPMRDTTPIDTLIERYRNTGKPGGTGGNEAREAPIVAPNQRQAIAEVSGGEDLSGAADASAVDWDAIAGAENPRQAALAAITRAEYGNFLTHYGDTTRSLAQDAFNDNAIANARVGARNAVREGFESGTGIAERQSGRYNQNLTADQKHAQDRRRQLGLARGLTHAGGTAGRQQADMQRTLRADLVKLAQGFRDIGVQGVAGAADAEAGRDRSYQQAKAQHKASQYQTLADLTSLGASAATAGGG